MTTPRNASRGIEVRGTDDPIEIAATVAAVLEAAGRTAETGYERWRRQRLAALRASLR